jgi:hypothetical protein
MKIRRVPTRRLTTALVALLVVLLSPTAAQAASKLELPDRGKLDEFGHVLLTVRYSCPKTTSAADSLLWLTSSQDQSDNFAAGDTAVDITCDGRRHRYQANLGPNIGDAYVRGTVLIEARLGFGADSIHASDSRNVRVR